MKFKKYNLSSIKTNCVGYNNKIEFNVKIVFTYQTEKVLKFKFEELFLLQKVFTDTHTYTYKIHRVIR